MSDLRVSIMLHRWTPIRRWPQRLYAKLNGYFWLPCNICGKMFGGHEWRETDVWMVERGRGLVVCRACGPEARRRTDARGLPRYAVEP